MGLEKVKQEILESAVKKAESITGAASSEAKEIARAVDKRLDEYGRLIEDEIEKAADALKRRELAATELEVRKGMLAAKSRAIEAVFSDARKRIGQLSDKRRESHVRALLDSARSELAVAVVICNPKDADVVGTFGKVKVVEDGSMLGGIIAESGDGRLRVDYSYDTLLGQVKSKVLSDVSRALFGTK